MRYLAAKSEAPRPISSRNNRRDSRGGFLLFLFLPLLMAYCALLYPTPGQAAERSVPVPLTDHPGNVYLVGEELNIRVPDAVVDSAISWIILNDRLEEIGSGQILERPGTGDRFIKVPSPGVGWYRIEFRNEEGETLAFTTAAVLARLKCPTPEDSPICVDAAMSWGQGDPGEQTAQASLAALAGVNWIRDRIRWGDVETEAGRFRENTVYDRTADLQSAAGLNILQTFHGTPSWVVGEKGNRARFPEDLREAYRFCKAMAHRFRGRVSGWEPWNEANAGNFGGHTLEEMCSYQKACYLGFKAGDPELVVGWNPCGGINHASMTETVQKNETWPYFDTYNIHSYDWPHAYLDLWAPAREVAAGKPLWVTECDRGVPTAGPAPWSDLPHTDDIRKAEFIAQSYASSLGAGATRHFHFLLRQYTEQAGTVQFGLLRRDGTPRPAYVALAAVGRLLAGAKFLGRYVHPDRPDVHLYAFRAKPDRVWIDVWVAWTETRGDWPERGRAAVEWEWPEGMKVIEAFDFLGRRTVLPGTLQSAPTFVVLAEGESDRFRLETRTRSVVREMEACSVVLQIRVHPRIVEERRQDWAEWHERVFATDQITPIEVVAYNFSDLSVSGRLEVEHLPIGCSMSPVSRVLSIAPGGVEIVSVDLRLSSRDQLKEDWVVIRGDFGAQVRPCVAFKVFPRQE